MPPSPGGMRIRLSSTASSSTTRASPAPAAWVQQPWPYDLGMTAVHEIGHWSGLYHTFQGGCDAPGDDVTDTAYEENAATGCPLKRPSACPDETRFDPVENYMDYSDDACMKHFTPMQYQRMKDMVSYYRYKLSPQTSPIVAARANPQKHRRIRLVLPALAPSLSAAGQRSPSRISKAATSSPLPRASSPVPILPERWQAYREQVAAPLGDPSAPERLAWPGLGADRPPEALASARSGIAGLSGLFGGQ